MSTQLNITLANSRLKAGDTTTVTFAFNEAVTNFTRDDVVLSDANGTLGEPTTSDNGRTWTATFTPTANVEDDSNTIRVNLAGVTNTAGTAGSGQASSANYGIDTRRPTVAITIADPNLGIGETTTATFTFSEAVTGFTLGALRVLSGDSRPVVTISDLRPSGTSGTVWTATVTPFADGDYNIGVDMWYVSDRAGNVSLRDWRETTYLTGNGNNVIVDLVRPTAASTNPITFADTDLGLGETTTVTFRFSEAISGFALDDIDLSQAHGTLSGLRSTSGDGSSGDTWTALFTPTANTTSLTNTLGINLAGVTDIAGNAGQGSVRSGNYAVKTQGLTATITLADTALAVGETTTVTFTFSETVTGFTRDDIVFDATTGTLGEPTTSDNGTTWTATFTPTANVEDNSNTIRVNLAGVNNAAGTAGSGQASSANYSIDTRRPTVTITVADEHLGIGETTTATFTFSEAVTGFTLGALRVLSGGSRPVVTISDLRPSGTSGTVWTATVTPFADGDYNIGVDMWYVSDRAGNVSLRDWRETTYLTGNGNNVIVDLVRPTAASTNPITLADTDLGLGETTTVTFRFSEAISGFALDDIDLSQAHGTLSGLRSTSGDGSSGDTWTALFTPTANTTSLTNTIAINLAGVRDIAGNAGQGSVRSGNYTVNTQGLSATITLADTALAAGETTTVTFTFSEAVTGFTRDDVVLSDANGTLGEPTTSDNGTTWAATFTPTANAATNTIRVNLAGVNTAAGTAGTGTASSGNFIVDTAPPVINTATVNGDQLVLTYTEANTLDGAALTGNAGFTVSNAAGTAITVNSAVVSATDKTVTLTLSRAVVQGEVVSLSYTKPATSAVVQDAAGNDAADFSNRAVTNTTPDTTPPQLITTGGGYQAPAISAYTGDVVLRFNDASNLNEDPARKPAAGDFTVLVDGVARTVTDVSVSAIANLITLSLATPVTHGQRVTVAYQDSTPTDTNGIQDTAGNLLTSIPTTAVLNALPDTTAPALSTATVNDNQLVLTYTDTSSLNGAALAGNAGFTVSSATGTAITVNSAVVHATNKTVTLTLSRTVANGETVTISYAKPATGNGVQDTAHNNAADFSSRTVINTTLDTTPPAFSSATVNGNQLVISYTEANTLDATALAGNAGFAVSSAAGTAITVNSAVVSATDKTVTLTLSRAVVQGEVVSVSYTKPATGNGVQDAAHNNAADFSSRTVTNNTPATPAAPADTTPPEFSSATVRDNQLVISYTEANTLDATVLAGNAGFTVNSTAGTAITVSSARVNATAKTVTLTLSRAVVNGETVTVSYTKPTTGNAVQDAAHNNAADFSSRAVTNTTPDTTPPEFSSATVRDNLLVISYTEANALDATALTGNAGFTVNSTAGTAITVTSAVVSATAKTVTLTLSRAVVNGETVTISYAKPTTGNGVQDAAHNNAADFSSRAVTNTTPDTTPPEFSSATVRDNLLVISYTEANALDATALAGNAGFTVNSTTGTAITVSSASVDATAKTVTLTLSRAVANGETVTVSYAKPAAGNGVQDAAHNNALDFSGQAVTNNTPATPTAPADTTPPEFSSATVRDNQLVISYTEANALDATALTGTAGFTVNSTTGTAITVSSASVNATAKTVTLTLSRSVANGETVTVSYAKPAAGNGVQDAAHNNAADFSGRAVTNNTPATPTAPADTTPPEFSSATVRDNLLVISYTEANALDATALTGNAGFTVNSTAGTAITVTSAVVSATAKTVTLTLSRAVVNGETVTISYAKPAAGNGVQDAAHNNAVDFSGRAVTNNTPATPATPTDTTPSEFSSATVTNNLLVISYTEANALDATALTGNAGFTVNSTAGTAITVTSAVVSATAKTVTLTLSRAVANGETVTVSYAKPAAGNGVQDAAHNNAADFSSRAVTNTTPDTTPPVFSSATVTDNQLVISYTEANALDATALTGNAGFTVNSTAGTAITVSSASVDATTKTVTLTLSRAVANGETVTVSYAKPAAGNGVQDAAHNNAADFSSRAVTNTTPDTTPPEFSSATVTNNQLVISYTEANTLDATALTGNAGFTVNSTAGTAITVSSASVDATTKTVTLTLSRSVANGETVTVSYAKPAAGNGVQDAAHNNALDFSGRAVTNNTPATPTAPADTTPPEFSSATVRDNQLVISYTEANALDATALTGTAGFTVNSTTGTAITVSSASVNATAKTVTLTLSRSVANGETVTVSYAKPAAGNGVQDAAHNNAADFSGRAVTNNTPATPTAPADTTPPEFSSATVRDNQLVISYTEANALDATAITGTAGFTVNSTTGTAITVSSAVVSATAKTVTLTLSRSVANGETVTISYAKPTTGNGVQDAAHNNAVDFSGRTVTNNTPATPTAPTDTTPPEFSSATVRDNQLVISYTEANALDATALTGTAGFTVNSTTGTAITVSSAVVSATAKTVTLTLSRSVANGETVTVSYAKPAAGNGVQDAAHNNAADFSGRAVTNTTPDTTPPEFSSATVRDNLLELSYADANKLDANHTAPASAFALSSSSDTAITVSSVAVTAKTVTLMLSRAVASDEKLTLSYTKPATGDNVIQDAAGNDAASFGNQAVGNLTPTPTPKPALVPTPEHDPGAPTPKPGPAPTPEHDSGASNADHDGVPDEQENQAIGPRGSARGDGNGDGIQDSAQAAVTSFSAETSSSSSTSVTLVADSRNGKVPSSSNTCITSLEQKAVPAQTPKALETPIALTSFKATLKTAGSTETFSLYVDPEIGANGYWLQDHGGTWVNLASSPYGGKMVDEGGRLRLDFTITDGGAFDADGKADGVITAPGAAAQMPLSIVGQAPDGTPGGFWF
ncbi:SwmB domain-containing protein [Verminephrobacter aporrectodeae]|uniref:SwmB domain-containing protein n=1 Tax=Verminephrobacter aporrectodeae TaxID=1110389 RepID=UPI002237FE17|nr:SwmB domain-containing protein [Verminephrobacter aporrectodeae]